MVRKSMLLLNKCYSSRDDIFKKAVQAQVILGLATLYAFTFVKFNEFSAWILFVTIFVYYLSLLNDC